MKDHRAIAGQDALRSFTWGHLATALALGLGLLGALAALGGEASALGGTPLLHGQFPVLAVHIHSMGFTVLGAEPALPASAAHIPCPSGQCQGPGSYNFSLLRARLARVKRADPHMETILLLTDPGTPMTVIYAAMAAATSNPLDPDEEGRPEALFPDVRVVPVAAEEG